MKKLKIIFAGTPDFAATHLQALLNSDHQVVAVYTMPDKPSGRGKKIQFSPVKTLALANNLPVIQPTSLKNIEVQNELASFDADIMVVVAYGMILPEAVLNIHKYGCINVHGSLLPRWRGAAPIQRSIWAGDKKTGVTIMQIDQGLDSGAILSKQECIIDEQETSSSLYLKLSKIGPSALLKVLNNIDNIIPEVQDLNLVTYANKLTKDEGKLDWNHTAIELERYIRAFIPFPYAYLQLLVKQELQTIKILKATIIENSNLKKDVGTILSADKSGIQIVTAKNILNIIELQPAGKKPMKVIDFLNGRADWFKIGDILA